MVQFDHRGRDYLRGPCILVAGQFGRERQAVRPPFAGCRVAAGPLGLRMRRRASGVVGAAGGAVTATAAAEVERHRSR